MTQTPMETNKNCCAIVGEHYHYKPGTLKISQEKNPAAVALGKLGGSKTSEKKKKAVAQNLIKAREAKKKPSND